MDRENLISISDLSNMATHAKNLNLIALFYI